LTRKHACAVIELIVPLNSVIIYLQSPGMPKLILHSGLLLSCAASLMSHEEIPDAEIPDAVSLLQLPDALEILPGGSSMKKQQHEPLQTQNSFQPDSANVTAFDQAHGAQAQTRQQDVHAGSASIRNNVSVASILQTELELLTFSATSVGFFGFLWFWIFAPIFICTGCCCCLLLCGCAGAYYQIKGSMTEFTDGVSSGFQGLIEVLTEPTSPAQKAAKLKKVLDRCFESMAQGSPSPAEASPAEAKLLRSQWVGREVVQEVDDSQEIYDSTKEAADSEVVKLSDSFHDSEGNAKSQADSESNVNSQACSGM